MPLSQATASNDEVGKKDPAGTFTATGQTAFTKDVSKFNTITLSVSGIYATGLAFIWEASFNGTAWFSVQGVRTDAAISETSTGALTANLARAWDIYIGPFNMFRVRSTAWAAPSGSAVIWCAGTSQAVDSSIVATLQTTNSNAPIVQGACVHSVPAPGSGGNVPVCGFAKTTIDTGLMDNDACSLTMTTARQLVTKDFGPAEMDWQYTVGALTTTTTAAAAAAARGANVRNYVTALQAINTSATATKLLILDGATTIFQIQLPANMTQAEKIVFPTPLRGTGATALNYNFSVAGATVDLNVQGFQNF